MNNNTTNTSMAMRGQGPLAQGGIVLLFALIALVSMTLAAVALLRSVDTSNLVAGNIALKQGAIQEGDRAMNEAFACLDTGGALISVSLAADNATCHYYAALQADVLPPFGIPDALESTSGVTSSTTGNSSYYVIERMCKVAGEWNAANCIESPFGKAADYTDRGDGAQTPPQALYRISVKIGGPRNVASYSQLVMNAGM
jgi:Tfp pilus assembly protein PilX